MILRVGIWSSALPGNPESNLWNTCLKTSGVGGVHSPELLACCTYMQDGLWRSENFSGKQKQMLAVGSHVLEW